MLDPAAETRRIVIGALAELLTREGITRSIDDQTKPLEELGLKSEHGVELACILEDRLHIEIPEEANPLVDDSPLVFSGEDGRHGLVHSQTTPSGSRPSVGTQTPGLPTTPGL